MRIPEYSPQNTHSLNVISVLGTVAFFCLLFLSACFTGIESTKKIKLSREDLKSATPTPEEKYFSGIEAEPLESWESGRKFLATDNKALLVFEPQGFPVSEETPIKGKELSFIGVESKINAAGLITVALVLGDGNRFYAYDTGKEFDDAMKTVKSDAIPMLVDEKMISQARELLAGKTFWTRSSLWYDGNGERITGRKYIPVTIEDVSVGNMVFPLRLKILTEEGEEAYLFMNFGNSDTESRAFHNLFYLSDIKKHYPGIQPEIWDAISRGTLLTGMTKEECKLSIGNPNDINSGHDYSQTLDIWTYEDGTMLWFEDGRLSRFRR